MTRGPVGPLLEREPARLFYAKLRAFDEKPIELIDRQILAQQRVQGLLVQAREQGRCLLQELDAGDPGLDVLGPVGIPGQQLAVPAQAADAASCPPAP